MKYLIVIIALVVIILIFVVLTKSKKKKDDVVINNEIPPMPASFANFKIFQTYQGAPVRSLSSIFNICIPVTKAIVAPELDFGDVAMPNSIRAGRYNISYNFTCSNIDTVNDSVDILLIHVANVPATVVAHLVNGTVVNNGNFNITENDALVLTDSSFVNVHNVNGWFSLTKINKQFG